MNAASILLPTLNPDLCYSALQSRDARFDGAFFVGAPTSAVMRWTSEDASKTLAYQALQLIDRAGGELSVVQVAAKMGITDRHLRRIFATEWGLTPQAYSQAQKTWLADKPHADWPAKDVLLQLPLHLPYDHAHTLTFFATRAIEGVEHIDEQRRLWRTIRLSSGRKTHTGWICADLPAIGLQAKRDMASTSVNFASTLPITVSASLVPVLGKLVPLLRAAFDLDAQPNAINALLLADFPNTTGQRVPGCFDGFELAVRAVLGQQITVQAAQTIANRLVARFGEPLFKVNKQTVRTELVEVLPFDKLRANGFRVNGLRANGLRANGSLVNRLFPSAAAVARASANDLGELGIVRQRQTAILGLAEAVQNGLDLSSKPRTPTELQATRDQLRAIKGIGEWTVAYVAMRALRDPDSFPAGDVALQNALGTRQASVTKSANDAKAQSVRWQPWRSYAVLRAWQRLEKQSNKEST